MGLHSGRLTIAVPVLLAAAFATVVILALSLGRLSLLRLFRRWLGASISAAAILTASTATFAIALFAALAPFFAVIWGSRVRLRGLCNLECFTWMRLPLGHGCEGDGTEGGE